MTCRINYMAKRLVDGGAQTRASWVDRFFAHFVSCGGERCDKLSLPATLFFSLLVLPAFRPTTMNWFFGGLVDEVWAAWRIFALVFAFVAYLLWGKKDLFSLAGIALLCVVVATSVINGGDLSLIEIRWVPCCTVILTANLAHRRFMREYLVAVLIVSGLESFINALFIVVSPEGFIHDASMTSSNNYFYGNYNTFYQIIFPSVTCSMLLDKMRGVKLSIISGLLIVSALIQVVATESATLRVSFCVYGAIVLLAWSGRAGVWLNGGSSLALGSALFFAVVVLRFQSAACALFGERAESLATVSDRTQVWDLVIGLMDFSHWWLGFGVSGYRLLQNALGRGYTHAHNGLLDVWFIGGALGLGCAIALLVFVSLSCLKRRSDARVQIIAATLCCFYLVGVAEPIFPRGAFCSFLALAYYYPEATMRIGDNYCQIGDDADLECLLKKQRNTG